MLEIKEEQLEIVLAQAIEQKNTLVSVTKKIAPFDSISLLESAKRLGMERNFWNSTESSFTLIGIGKAYEIQVKENHLKKTKQEWKQLQKETYIQNPFNVPGTGLVAVGGMDFDPLKPQTVLWENFAASQLTIPEFVFVKQGDHAYLTVNLPINKIGSPNETARKIEEIENQLTNQTIAFPSSGTISEIKERYPEEWKATVRLATDEIKKGKAEKIVLARELRLKLSEEAEISTMVQRLIEQQPSSFIFAMEHKGDCFIGATPERLVKLEKNELLSACIAGTAPRGTTKEDDETIGQELMNDHKNRQEHDYVVQMIRQAMQPLTKNMEIPEKPVLLPLRNLQHLYTPVRAQLLKESSIFDIIEVLHPTPALGGTPREEALSFIREQEMMDRGWYGAPVGWLDSNDNGEFAVAIRSGLIQGDEASLFAGCGVVADSDPEAEYEETKIKFTPMLSLLGG